jgi:glutaredoxin 3
MTQAHTRRRGAARSALVLLCAVGGLACDPSVEEAPAPSAPPAAPAPLAVPGDGQVYRYVDPSDGAVKTAASVEGIPESARGAVVVFDAAAPTPPGWEHVVNLTGGAAAETVPTQGFVLRPSVVIAPPSAVASKAAKRGHDVVMFSTQGCGYCRKARAFFKKHGVAHSEYDVERDPKAGPKLAELAKRAGVPTSQLQGGVPLIFIDGTPHVGFDKGKVARLLGI